jgi:ribosomal protein L37E
MNKKDRILLGLLVASFVTMLHIGWRKFGGLASGGRYSDSHTWTELYLYLPEFAFLFAIVFTGFFVWQGMKKNEIYFKCPQCGKVKATFEKNESICQECGAKLEHLDGFYERHSKKK